MESALYWVSVGVMLGGGVMYYHELPWGAEVMVVGSVGQLQVCIQVVGMKVWDYYERRK